jgi:hypothetical protein
MLYLGTTVLILYDLSYASRFWTQFEAWLSMQFATPDGLKSAVGTKYGRCNIVCIQNAAEQAKQHTQLLVDQWATKTPQQALEFLSKPDVTVTNMSDKDGQLSKIMTLDATVKGAFQAIPLVPDKNFRGPYADRCKPLVPYFCVSADGEAIFGCVPTDREYFLPACLHMALCPQLGCDPRGGDEKMADCELCFLCFCSSMLPCLSCFQSNPLVIQDPHIW